MLNISVLVPTYQRIQDLERCLLALSQQTRLPDEVVVVVRDNDSLTQDFLKQVALPNLCIRRVNVRVTGQVAALNQGLDSITNDIVAIIDDDAAPRSTWLAKIEHHFNQDPHLAGVGGRDWVHENGIILDQGEQPVVGLVQWFGRVIGNHHLGTGTVRSVDTLKGANMSFRRSKLQDVRFDTKLLGSGAQSHNDLNFCLNLRRKGARLIYDPSVAVDHYPGTRFDLDQRWQFSAISTFNTSYNEAWTILHYLPLPRCWAYLGWRFLIGSKSCPGCLQLVRIIPSEGLIALKRWLFTQRGCWAACGRWLQEAIRQPSHRRSSYN
jgi:GT2 family glycosyltransferase